MLTNTLTTDIHIYQNYLSLGDLPLLDPDSIPNAAQIHREYETRVFFDFYRTGKYQSAPYVGVISKRFTEKTQLTIQQFKQFIVNNPGYDVYFINPFPQNAYFSHNIWHQGEYFHPGIIQATQRLFDAAQLPIQLAILGRHTRSTLLYCNYWVGNQRFWKMYMDFLLQLYPYAKSLTDIHGHSVFFQDTAYLDLVSYTKKPAALFPFVYERLFSTYLMIQPDLRYLAYEHTHDEIYHACLNTREAAVFKEYNAIIDNWDATMNYPEDYYARFDTWLAMAWSHDRDRLLSSCAK